MKILSFHRLWRPLAAAFIGASTTFSFAPYDIWPLAILSPVILMLLLHNQSPKASLWTGFAWGLGQFATGISWVHISIDTFGGMPKIASVFLMTLLVSYLALYPALYAWLLNRFFPRLSRHRFFLAAPVLWLICDWLRGWIMTGFPWLWLGYSQLNSPLANFAPLGGVELITLAIMVCASAISYSMLTKRWMNLIIPAVIFATGFGLNAVHWVTPKDKVTKFALIQGNIDQALKWVPSQRWPTILKYTDLSRDNWDADIIIWPEAAIPAFEFEVSSFLQTLDEAARNNDSALITGVINRGSGNQYYNSVLTLGNTDADSYQYNIDKRYHKHHLLPFGEFVPFESLLRPLAPFFNLPMSSFTSGDYIQPNIVAKGRHLAPALCYEIIFSEQVRANVNDNTDFILTLSNDAWFGRSIGPLQHMQIAQMRALELGKPVIRSTNNGLTAVTDYRGQITDQLPQFETGVLRASVHSTSGQTPYHGWGSWPLYLFSVLALAIAWRRRSSTDK
ncbi:Apolipoprotein N-acyltransferase [Vibrio xiamenensis]|uniref:Apolipoprotein N-acyltransferase n=1 Tax=Vibrio xiamenensis TaxID=861298 RepID=A0A1G8E8Z6_9VIBR|nr:apolipoprotein N-acyltransferase [Vibrio xiamenensis]SDH66386.1 Apolipoprotein N-acyltransferase [Vibrio xiamenensis]